MKLLRYAALALVLVFAVSAGTGCSKLWPWGKKPALSGLGTGDGSGLDLPKGGDGWGSTGDKLGGGARKGEIVPIKGGIPGWPEGDPSTIVYFDFDRSDVKASEQPKLEALAKIMEENPTYAVRVEGSCDERGSPEYNRGLGQRRAESVRSSLVSLGVAEARIDTLSNGSEKPAVPGAADENGHAKNRRAEFVIGLRAE